MSWVDRIKPKMKLTSPMGQLFEAFWVGNQVSKTKKLGLFSNPNFKGTIVQDLGITGDSYPLPIFFSGPDHDLIAKNFWIAASETGPWKIEHPILGPLSLQLMSIEMGIQPVTDGNISQFQLEFIEPAKEDAVVSDLELASGTKEGISKVNGLSASQFKKGSLVNFETLAEKIRSTTKDILDIYNNVFDPLISTVNEVQNLSNEIVKSIQSILNATILKPVELASGIQQLVRTPALASRDFEVRTSKYSEFLGEIFKLKPEGNSLANTNEIQTVQVAALAVVPAISDIALSTDFISKEEAITTANYVTASFLDIVNKLDESMGLYRGKNIGLQYFSQSESYQANLQLIALILAFIIDQGYRSNLEKKMVLTKPETPIALTIQEYGSLGNNDILLDFFIASNRLKNNEILLLPAGKAISIYL
jgi:hypothetical protein